MFDLKKSETFSWVWENYLVGKESVDICGVVNMFSTLCVSDTQWVYVTVKILCNLLHANF